MLVFYFSAFSPTRKSESHAEPSAAATVPPSSLMPSYSTPGPSLYMPQPQTSNWFGQGGSGFPPLPYMMFPQGPYNASYSMSPMIAKYV